MTYCHDKDQHDRSTEELREENAKLLLQIEEGRKKTLMGLWHLLRAYAGGGMPPMVTQGIKLACRNVGMSEDHIASAELGGDDPDFVKRETEKRDGLTLGESRNLPYPTPITINSSPAPKPWCKCNPRIVMDVVCQTCGSH